MRLLFALIFLVMACCVQASPLVYAPVNPAFGGNPLNGSWLLSNAQAQSRYKDPSSTANAYKQPTALDRFMDSLQSNLLNQLLQNVGNGQGGHLETNAFIIDIVDGGSGLLTITVTDRATGAVSTVEVNGLGNEL
jgi:curli production assembly/transport component CsgF